MPPLSSSDFRRLQPLDSLAAGYMNTILQAKTNCKYFYKFFAPGFPPDCTQLTPSPGYGHPPLYSDCPRVWEAEPHREPDFHARSNPSLDHRTGGLP